MLTRNEAAEVCTLIEVATEMNWDMIVENIGDKVDISLLCKAVEKLCDEAHVSVPFTESDFE